MLSVQIGSSSLVYAVSVLPMFDRRSDFFKTVVLLLIASWVMLQPCATSVTSTEILHPGVCIILPSHYHQVSIQIRQILRAEDSPPQMEELWAFEGSIHPRSHAAKSGKARGRKLLHESLVVTNIQEMGCDGLLRGTFFTRHHTPTLKNRKPPRV